jgi:hypothetical protein
MKMSCPLNFVENADHQTYYWNCGHSHHYPPCCDALPGHHLEDRNKIVLIILVLKFFLHSTGCECMMLTHWHISKIKNKHLLNFNFSHPSSSEEIMIMVLMMNAVVNEKVLKRRDICEWKS